MNEKQVKIALGGMLHDVGKILYRYNDGRNHSTSGYEFLKEHGISDDDILDQVRYHHRNMIKGTAIADNSLAYITYWADNVAAAADRRRNKEEPEKHGYDKFMPLESIFNVLNNNDQKHTYDMAIVYDSGELNYPSESDGQYSKEIYGRIRKQLLEGLNQIELDERYVNSLLGVLEANMSFVPSSTDKTQLADISLFDHSKITAAVGSCIYEYLEEQGIGNYKQALFENAADYYEKNCFLMFSMDISGIQDFIYTVHSEGALKMLRSKSFYLEMMLEHIIDILIERIGVSRANLIYSGGGHAYMLLPATEKVKSLIDGFEKELNDWYIDNFRTALYIACGYAECSANNLRNEPDGSYKDIFMNVSRVLSAKKASRYSAEQIVRLNDMTAGDHERECKVCGRVDHLAGDLCEFCSSLKELSSDVLDKDFVTILSVAPDDMSSVPMPLGYHMIMESEKELLERLKTDESYVRSYSKNKMFTGYNVSTRLWTGSYCNGSSFEDLAGKSEGIRRIGVLRADVDNLGTAFVRGFERSNGSQQYVSISRTATFSRKLNMFFKLHINYLLGSAKYSMNLDVTPYPQRSALIVYSGGDDLFIVGAWNEIIEAAVDINDALKKYTQGTLTLSAGIGIFPQKYPVKALARQTGELEDASKQVDGKDAISLFEPEKHTYKWEIFKKNVIDEKYTIIKKYFSGMQDKGMSAMYKLMGYIRNLDDKINLARLAYMLGRMEPDRNASQELKDLYSEFSRSLYKWVSNDKDSENRRELLTAIYLYVYLHRDNGR